MLQIFGRYGGALMPLRFFALLIFPFLIVQKSNGFVLKNYLFELYFALLLCIYGVFFLTKVQDTLQGFKEIFYIIVNIVLVADLILLSVLANNPVFSIIKGWLLLFLISVPIALIEIFFDYHFATSILGSGEIIGGVGGLQRYAALTYGNYNQYNTILVYILPFIFASLFVFKKRKHKFIIWIFMLIFVFIAVVNSSRGLFLAIVLSFLVFLFYNLKLKRFIYPMIVVTILFFLSPFIINSDNEYFVLFNHRINYLFEGSARIDVFFRNMNLLEESNYLGVGPGNLIAMSKNKAGVSQILAPHNLFLEILVQYGVFVFLGFIIVLVKVVLSLSKLDFVSRFIVISSLLLLPISSIINSVYIALPYVWVMIGSLMVIVNSKFKTTIVND